MAFWERFRPRFRTRTRDTGQQALIYLRAQMTMDTRRNFANIGRRLGGEDGQRLQHFMSESPWSGADVFEQIQTEIAQTPALAHASTLILDESADEKAGRHSAGASCQYNGRMGTIDLCRVDTCLALANLDQGLWTMVDAELFLPKEWFTPKFAKRRKDLGIPKQRRFATKLELGLAMVRRAQQRGLPFDLLACDALYGRDFAFRADLDALGVPYAAQVPSTTLVYLDEPEVGVPPRRSRTGPTPFRERVLNEVPAIAVRDLVQQRRVRFRRVTVRSTERGPLVASFGVRQVWTWAEGQHPRAEWLVIRRDSDGTCTHTLLNAEAPAQAEQLVRASCQRYFVERVFEDAKTEIGFDEFCAQKYRAWEHHLALTGLALWFVAQTKMDLARDAARDPNLARILEVEVLPALSTSNIRELMKAIFPLPRLTLDEAIELVGTHLLNRVRSLRSRSKGGKGARASP
jgi:SRSO17 transposase